MNLNGPSQFEKTSCYENSTLEVVVGLTQFSRIGMQWKSKGVDENVC